MSIRKLFGRRAPSVGPSRSLNATVMRWFRNASMLLAAFLLNSLVPAYAVGYAPTDFVVAGYSSAGGNVAVYKQDLTFKGYLDTNFSGAVGLDLTSDGRLVVAAQFPGRVRVYNPDGTLSTQFTDAALGVQPFDVKVGPGDLLYVGTQGGGAVSVRRSSICPEPP